MRYAPTRVPGKLRCPRRGRPYTYLANFAAPSGAARRRPALDCVNRGLTFAPVKKGTEDGVMHDYFSLLLTTLYNIYYLYK